MNHKILKLLTGISALAVAGILSFAPATVSKAAEMPSAAPGTIPQEITLNVIDYTVPIQIDPDASPSYLTTPTTCYLTWSILGVNDIAEIDINLDHYYTCFEYSGPNEQAFSLYDIWIKSRNEFWGSVQDGGTVSFRLTYNNIEYSGTADIGELSDPDATFYAYAERICETGDFSYHAPSPSPSEDPEPSVDPTHEAGEEPSEEPSAPASTEEPWNEPSASPSASVAPSTQPSASTEPSAEPSASASAQPSEEPSAAASTEPSSAPSTEPSAEPSSEPSVVPSTVPSEVPSATPSEKPEDPEDPAVKEFYENINNTVNEIENAVNSLTTVINEDGEEVVETKIIEYKSNTAVSARIINAMSNAKNVTLVYTFEYEGIVFKAVITPEQAALMYNENIKWYGPCYIAENFPTIPIGFVE